MDNQNNTLASVKKIIDSHEEMKDFITSKSKLYTAYSVRDKEGNFTSVVDVDSVIEIIRDLIK